MKRNLLNYFGLAGVVSFISYFAAVVFSPLAYEGYDWLSQAVSDLSASNAPSLGLWNELSSLYNVCEVLCVACVCAGIQKSKNKTLKTGIYIFGIMEFVSAVGYRAFPLSESGFGGTFKDVMHMVTTAVVVCLSIASLVLVMIAGYKNKKDLIYAIFATVALAMMLVGALGMKIVPQKFFGVVERFSVFAATGFNAFLGVMLFLTDLNAGDKSEIDAGTGETKNY